MSEEHTQGELYPLSLETLKFLFPSELPVAFDPKKKAAASRGRMLHLLAEALDAASDGIIIFDLNKANLPICYANSGFERMTGYPRKETIGQSLNFLHGPNTCMETVQKLHESIRRKRHIILEILQYKKDGSPIWVMLSLTPIQVEEMEGDFCVGILCNITQRIESEGQIQETMRLLESSNLNLTKKNQLMEQQLSQAEKIQRSLLPTVPPETDTIKFGWVYEPSEGLAGDSLNIFWLDKTHIGIYLIDVTGHGTAAALLAVSVSKMLQSSTSTFSLIKKEDKQTHEFNIVSPAEVANQLNTQFPWDPDGGQFFTMVYGILDTKTLEFQYACAGHPCPLYITPGNEIEFNRGGGVPIGLASKPYGNQVLQLEPGGRLVIYSDGITEVMNERQKLWGQIRLSKALRTTMTLDIKECLDDILLRTDYWCGSNNPVNDDRTIIGMDILRIKEADKLSSSNFGVHI